MLESALFLIAFAFGLAVGRWWALWAALALGIVVWSSVEVEVSHLFLGVFSGAIAATGIAGGVGLRKRRPQH